MVIDTDKRKNTVYLSLGSNLGDRRKNFDETITLLEKQVGELTCTSSIYETEGWGEATLNNFYNSVIILETELEPKEILQKTQAIERKLGREAKTKDHYENRIIDIDILFFNNKILNYSNLIVPHPLLVLRRFVLEPLYEISPAYVHPKVGLTVEELYNNLEDKTSCIKLS